MNITADYTVHASMYVDGKLKKSLTTACFGMLACPQYFDGSYWTKNEKGQSVFLQPVYTYSGQNVYLSNFGRVETLNYQTLLISTINEITPCAKVVIDKQEYIEFKMLQTYDQSLILLNFIRNLWHEPVKGYTKKFFETLEKEYHPDPLVRLINANIQACEPVTYFSMGHSNVYQGKQLKVKTTAQLLAYTGNSTAGFLTT